MQILPSSYRDYINGIANLSDSPVAEQTNNILQKINGADNTAPLCGHLSYILDFSRQKYTFITLDCIRITGYKPDYFLQGGLEAAINKWKHAEFELYNKKIFPENMRFLKDCPPEQISNLIFSYTYSFIYGDGSEGRILQRSSFITDPSGFLPIGVTGTMTDITHFASDRSMMHTIEAPGEGKAKLLYKKIYFPDESFTHLSKKELEVLKWICEGFTSKEIADKICLSPHTINNHRKNMLRKTNCNSSAALLHYAIKNRLL